jgi:hypothetical protein
LWYAAHHLPGVFNAVVIIGIVAGIVFLFRRILSGTAWFPISLFLLVGITAGAVVVGLPAVAAIAAVATTALIAWRVVPN